MKKSGIAADMARAEKIAWIHAVAAEEGEGCRDWPWALNNLGYGVVRWSGKTAKVTHAVLELAGHERPEPRAFALHSCDRPICAAPWHLRWGTAADNMTDCVTRGRNQKGSRNGVARLSEADVEAIRASPKTLRELGEEYGVHFTVIGRARRGATWKHV